MNDRSQQQVLNRAVEHHDLGVVDSKGRRIGCLVIRSRVVYTPADPAETQWYRHPAGEFFALQVQPTRNGAPYSASRRARTFPTVEAREKAAAAHLARVRRKLGAA